MSSNLEVLLERFITLQEDSFKRDRQRTRQRSTSMIYRDAVETSNEAQLFYASGGLFADCTLERPVLNATLNPTQGLANMIPVQPTTDEQVKFGFLTDIADGEAGPQDTPCEPAPETGNVSACFASFGIGRLEYQTRTMEIDALIRKAHRGIQEDLYFVGDIRGVSALQPARELVGNNDLITQGAVRRQIMLWGRRTQKTLRSWFWSGNPTAGAQNGAGGGWKSFWGLNSLIANDYDSKAFVTGTNCAALNSVVTDISLETGDGQIGIDSVYAYMQEVESSIYMRAQLMGLLPTTWVWVMHPITWSELVKYLPCDMISDSCSVPSGTTKTVNLNDGGTGIFNLAMRQQLMNTMSIDVNGRNHTVVLDDTVPVTQGTIGTSPVYPTYRASIYFVPLNVAGEDVLYWRHMDYSLFDEALSPIPGNLTDMRGWSDGARFHWIIERLARCFVIRGKVEPALVFRAPHLAGRIDGTLAVPKLVKPRAA